MAWQLIYTSAPRLLEAGRTGFGTVARHRAVSGLLATTIERLSQFARLPGHDPRRVVYSHRILTIGGGRFHALSCLRDAGSDYTSRTNHLAHHLIVEEREVRPLIAVGITPADVLLAMNWRVKWAEGPRFLDVTEEIDLASMTTASSQLWERVTGVAHGSRLLWSPAAQRGCYLIIPSGVDARVLFRESLHEKPDQAWQTTFTTSLEPNDAVADFRWIGIAPQSPLRGLMETSARPIFDLQHPASLPPLPEPEPNDAAIKSAPDSAALIAVQTTPQPEQDVQPAPAEETPHDFRATDELPATGCDPQTAAAASDQKRGRRLSVLTVAAWFSVVAVAASLFFYQARQSRRHVAITQLEQQVDDTWKKYHLKLPETQNWLKQQARENSNRDAIASLIATHAECIQQIRRSLETAQPEQGVTIPDRTRDDFSEMLTAHAEWLKQRATTALPADWKPRQPSDVKVMTDRWKDERRAWRHFAAFFTREPVVDQSGHEELVRRVLDVFNAAARPAGTPAEWRQILNDLGAATGTSQAIGRLEITTSLPVQAFNRSTP